MKRYTIGLITGALLGISAMMFIGAQNKNLGDITADSITAKTIVIGSELGMTVIVGGALSMHQPDGKKIIYLGTGESFGGHLQTFSKHEVLTGFFGTNKDNDGVAILYDRYGDVGWLASGKQ